MFSTRCSCKLEETGVASHEPGYRDGAQTPFVVKEWWTNLADDLDGHELQRHIWRSHWKDPLDSSLWWRMKVNGVEVSADTEITAGKGADLFLKSDEGCRPEGLISRGWKTATETRLTAGSCFMSSGSRYPIITSTNFLISFPTHPPILKKEILEVLKTERWQIELCYL